MGEVIKNQQLARYRVSLTTTQPFHIGAFQDPMSDVHNPFTTLGGMAVVQGSSLKGAYRAQLEEYLILNYGDDASMQPCIPAPWNNLSQDERSKVNYRGEKRAYRGENCGAARGRSVSLCPTCYVLGAMGVVGFVQVPYLYLASEDDVEEVYQNRRDRVTDTVAHGANRTMQAIPAGARFEGTMEVLLRDQIRDWRLGLARPLERYRDDWLQRQPRTDQDAFIQEFVLDRLTAIPRMGGMISKGFGGIEIAVEEEQVVAY